ncbi:hypothetical protein GE061_019134 [Apolygus lucorum]|uniref:Uncharacterized protein n=1 Tax=Apolygus lucorum TaxID=248454 RepID=A0A8S9X7K4_APOLU|nr:hypothetical protein GE061_019134 [Apolygus lucorum]
MGGMQVILCLSVILVGVTAAGESPKEVKRIPKQINKGIVLDEDEEDRKAEGTGFESFGGFEGGGGGGGGGGKYFMDTIWEKPSPDLLEFGHVCEDPHNWEQRFERLHLKDNRRQGQLFALHRYQHVPKKDHYEFGFKRGNEHHVKERHEKAHPHAGHFKTKVRWADKHGGHGEHYWDYNHHGHHGDEGAGDEADEASDRVNSYSEDRSKRDGAAKKPDRPPAALGKDPSLVYNVEAKTVTDQNTGQVYVLYPID